MLRRLCLLAVCAGQLAACAPSPATPRAGEIEGLRARVQRSGGDTESALRLAAGLWAEGDRAGARRVLEEARSRAPDSPVYVAALGVAAEASSDYGAARALYMEFLDATLQSALSVDVAERVRVIRGETAEPLVASLLAEGRTLSHGFGSDFVLALFPLRPDGDDPEIEALAAAATELLEVQLQSVEPFRVLDWETSEAALGALAPGTPSDVEALATRPAVRDTLATLLDVQYMAWGQVARTAPDSVVFTIGTSRPSSAGALVRTDSMRASIDDLASGGIELTRQVWATLLGASYLSPPRFEVTYAPIGSTSALLAMGEGLLRAGEGDRVGARRQLDAALAASPDFPPLRDRAAQLASLDAFESSSELPLADEILEFARMEEAAVALARSSEVAPLTLGDTRSGLSEALGLDRVGSQLFIDLVIDLGGSP